MQRSKVFFVVLAILFITGCSQGASLPASNAAEPEAASIPAGWSTYTSQQCEYAISHPTEMAGSDQNPYSRLFNFKSADPDAAHPNFVYVSVIAPEVQNMVEAGIYNAEVYNYDPAQTDILLGMQVGESKTTHPAPDVQSGFTYQRLPDAAIGGHTSQAYENVQPWEFPAGTKEIRYYSSLNGCIYLIGGYVDTTGSNQPGAITEDVFQQIIATVELMP